MANPAKFAESNACLQSPEGMTDGECGPLHVLRYNQGQLGATVSCWKLSIRERLSILFFGRLWLWVFAGGETQPPVAMMAAKSIFKTEEKDVQN